MFLPARRWRLPYLALLTVVGLLLSASALESYRLSGGTRPWEPQGPNRPLGTQGLWDPGPLWGRPF